MNIDIYLFRVPVALSGCRWHFRVSAVVYFFFIGLLSTL